MLKQPQYVVPAAMICFGYPTEQQQNREKPARFAVKDMVHENGYCMEKSAAMPRMLRERQEISEEELAGWTNRFCKRKWNSEFSQEMSRSCTEMVKDWCSE